MPIVIIAFAVRVTSNGPIIYWSDRIGRNNIVFKMPKFRTMKYDTPPMATHLMKEPHKFLSPIGGFLRKYSLDEIPQLYSIIKGNMSLVGPRPALFNQYDLIKLRTENKLDNLVPGLTGWAQINGRDEISIEQKVQFDTEYLERQSILFDFEILFKTFMQSALRRNISH